MGRMSVSRLSRSTITRLEPEQILLAAMTRSMKKICMAASLAIAMVVGVSVNADASDIIWETAVPVDNAGSFVNRTGSSVVAVNSDDAGDDAFISGVVFAGTDLAGWNAGVTGAGGVTISSNATRGNFGSTFVQGSGPPPSITDAAINNLIGSGIWNSQTITITGLTPGDTYIIQIIGNDSRNGRDETFVTLLSDGVNDVASSLANGTAGLNPLSNSAPTGANPRLPGSAIIGTFTADASTQTFDVRGTTDGGASFNDGRGQINGFQLRTTSVLPELTPFVHPGISHKQSDLERMKLMADAGVEPWATGMQNLRVHPRAQFDFPVDVAQVNPLAVIEYGQGTRNFLRNDSSTAYFNALMWYFTGDVRHADKAIEVFNAYKTLRRNTDIPLFSGRIIRLIEAAEIIKNTSDRWDPVDMQEFKDMLVYPGYSSTNVPTAAIDSDDVTFYWKVYDGDPSRIGNQGLLAMRLMMAMGIFLDNEKMYDRTVRYVQGLPRRPDDLPHQSGPAINGDQEPTCDFYEQHDLDGFSSAIPDFGFNEVIEHYIYENGQSQEADRDQAHSIAGVSSICGIGEIAWNQGDDVYGAFDNRALLGLEYYIHYNLSFEVSFPDQPTPWDPTVESGEFLQRAVRNGRRVGLKINPGVNCDQGNLTRGIDNLSPIYELGLAHYRDRMNVPADNYKWLQRGQEYLVSQIGVEGVTNTIAYPLFGSLFYRRVSPGDPISGFNDNGLPQYAMNMLPGTIEAENFDYFTGDGQGRTYSDSTPGNQGGAYRFDSDVDVQETADGDFCIGATTPGEFLTYTVNVPESGDYTIRARIASDVDGAFIRISSGGIDRTGVIEIPNTGDSQNFTTVNIAEDVRLNQGVQQMKVEIFGAFSLDSLSVNDFLLGDVNRDGVVNFLDISPFISLLSTGDFQNEADMNGDGKSIFSTLALSSPRFLVANINCHLVTNHCT